MKCDEVIGFISPYIDSELDPTTTFQIQTHLSRCAECRHQYEFCAHLDKRMAQSFKAIPSRRENELNWSHLLNAAVARPQRDSSPNSWRTSFFKHSKRLYWPLLVASLILLAFSTLTGNGFRHLSYPMPSTSPSAARSEQGLREAAISRHVGLINDEWSPELYTESHESMKRYFSKNNISFPDSRIEMRDVQMIGASCSDLNGIPAACILCKYQGRLVTLYVLDQARAVVSDDDGRDLNIGDFHFTKRTIGRHLIIAVHDHDSGDIGRLMSQYDEGESHRDSPLELE